MMLLKNRNLRLLLGGQFVSQVGDKFYMLALAIWVLETTGSTALMGSVLFCSLFPTLLVGFIAGTMVDRWDRKFIIVAADVVRGIVILAVALFHFYGTLSLPIVFASQILLSVCAAFFNPAVGAVIPKIIDGSRLNRANAMTGFIRGASGLIGPFLGGITVAGMGYAPVFALNAGSFLLSALFESFLDIPSGKKKNVERPGVSADVREGFNYILTNRNMLVILFMIGMIHFFVGSMEVLTPVFSTTLSGSGAKNLGYLQTSLGIGTLLMALFLSLKSNPGQEVMCLFASTASFGFVLILVSWIISSGQHSLLPYIGPFLLLGAFIVLAATCFRTLLQANTPDRMTGRVFGAAGTIGDLSLPGAMLIYGFLLKWIDCGTLFAATGCALSLLSTIFYLLYKGACRSWIPGKNMWLKINRDS